MNRNQMLLNLDKGTHGGRRTGSGRKRIHSKGVAHRKRERVIAKTPLHINFKYRLAIKNKFCLRVLKKAIIHSRKKGLRVIHFSLQHNHVHLIVESDNNKVLTTGMRSLLVTFAKNLKNGRVQVERYHLHVLKSVQETRNAINYVLFNEQRHSSRVIGEFSSLTYLPDAIKRIRDYVRGSESMVVVLKVRERLELDKGKSFLLRKALPS